MPALRKPFDVTYVPAQPAREASGGYTQCGYFITGYGPYREVNCRVTGYYTSNGTWIPLYTCDLVRDPIYTYKCEYIPYVPASPGAPARIDKTARIGWDAGATSAASYSSDCELAFSLDPVVGAYVGLTNSDYGADPSRLRYAFLLYQASYQQNFTVVVDGAQCIAPRTYSPGAVFKIQRAAGVITFLVDDTVVFSAPDTTDGADLWAGTTLYASGDAVPEIDACCAP